MSAMLAAALVSPEVLFQVLQKRERLGLRESLLAGGYDELEQFLAFDVLQITSFLVRTACCVGRFHVATTYSAPGSRICSTRTVVPSTSYKAAHSKKRN